MCFCHMHTQVCCKVEWSNSKKFQLSTIINPINRSVEPVFESLVLVTQQNKMWLLIASSGDTVINY